MPLLTNGLSRLLGGGVRYVLRDEFTTDRAAGAVNGTAAEPGPGTRTVVDAENKLTISSDKLTFAGGKAAPGMGDPGVQYAAIARAAGRLVGWRVRLPATNKEFKVGLASLSSNPLRPGFDFNTSAGIRFDNNGAAGPVVGAGYAANTDYILVAALRAAGVYGFVQGGVYGNFTLLFGTPSDTTASLNPAIANYDSSATADWIRVPTAQYLPAPLASDGFSGTWGATDGTGHGETSGLGAGGSGKAWTTRAGTIGITGGKAQASALDGTSGRAIATVDVGNQDVFIMATLTRVAGEIGIIVRYYDADNWLSVSHDGTNLIWRTRLGGTEGTTTGAATFGAGRIGLWVSGNSVVHIWNAAKVGATRSATNKQVNDPVSSNNFGIFTTDLGNTVDDLVIIPIGNRGEHAQLHGIFGVALPTFVAFDGNSLTAGTTPTADSYPAQCLALLGTGYCGVNWGVYGQNIANMSADAATEIDPNVMGGRKNICVCWEATNSLPNMAAQDCYDAHVAYCAARRAAGWRVVIGTCLPSQVLCSTQDNKDKRAAFNTLIRNNWTTFADALADVAANTTIGDDGDETNLTNYLADQTHMTATGYGIVAGIVRTAVAAL